MRLPCPFWQIIKLSIHFNVSETIGEIKYCHVFCLCIRLVKVGHNEVYIIYFVWQVGHTSATQISSKLSQ